MYIYPADRKVLKSMIAAQQTLSCWVILDTDSNFHHCPAPDHSLEGKELDTEAYCSQLDPTTFKNALDHLKKSGYIEQRGMGSCFYHVTYDGWNVIGMQKHETIVMIVTHFLFPSAVAFITTLLTLFLTKQ